MESPEPTVLIGTTLSSKSDAVVRTGIAVARSLGARVALTHVVSFPQPFARLLGIDSPGREALEGLEAAARQQVRTQAQSLGLHDDGLAAISVQVGAPHRLLAREARARKVKLLVVGTAEGSVRPLGSTAERVVRRASCPVLVVRDGMLVPPARVLAAVDLSPLSVMAFKAGLAWLAEVCKGAAPEVQALFVLSPFESYVGEVEVDDATAERAARERLERLAARHGAGLEVRAQVRRGEAREGILAEIERQGTDLVILGTHGYGGLDRLLLGSVAGEVLRRSPTSALVVPPEDEDEC